MGTSFAKSAERCLGSTKGQTTIGDSSTVRLAGSCGEIVIVPPLSYLDVVQDWLADWLAAFVIRSSRRQSVELQPGKTINAVSVGFWL